MSAFMCTPETIYAISDYLFNLKTLFELKSLGIISKEPLSVERFDLFKLLYDLNKKALDKRYEDRADELVGYEPEAGFKQARKKYGDQEAFISEHLLFFKMECFLYQCEEDCMENESLLKYLTTQQAELAASIVRSSKEYQDISVDEWN